VPKTEEPETPRDYYLKERFIEFIKKIAYLDGIPPNVTKRIWDTAAIYGILLFDENAEIVALAEAQAVAMGTKKAADARYSDLRAFKIQAASVAKQKWENGSDLLHHQMVKYLMEEYQDANGKYQFMLLPDKDKSSPDRVLLKTVKAVAIDMDRRDLLSGLKVKKSN